MKPSLSYCITNREFKLPDDGWFHIAPIGTFPHPSGVSQVLDKESIDAMVDSFREDEEEAGDHFPGLLVDFDHFSNDPKAPSEAAGWITDMESRDDGLWAQIHWSDTGEAAVKGGRYRLVSPVWDRSDCEDLGKNSIRPLRLDRVAVTNDPNLKGMLPLSNRDQSDRTATEDVEAEVPVAATKSKPLKNRKHFIFFDREWIPLAADKRRVATKQN